nr:hypothetical protein [Paraburkholderia sp. J10-1]
MVELEQAQRIHRRIKSELQISMHRGPAIAKRKQRAADSSPLPGWFHAIPENRRDIRSSKVPTD